MKKKFINKTLTTCGMTALLIGTMLTGKTMATETKDYTKYPNDVTPPWGRITIQGATEINNINYIDREKITVQVYANDDMCEDNEISYYVSTSEISRTTEITNWKSLKDGNTVEITLPSTTSTNTIYAVFKDYNGNTSLIYTGTNQTVTYDANSGDNAPTGGTRIIGAPFVVTNLTPEREGYYFLGWSTDKGATKPSFYAGDIIPAEMIIGEGANATLYAVWTEAKSDLAKLSKVVKVGDYVNYPVYYENITSYDGSYLPKRNGWRVLSVEDDGTVNLISAGVPLTYYHQGNSARSIQNLLMNFLNVEFGTGTHMYSNTGFSPYKTLKEIFTNEYTAVYEEDETITYTTTYNDGTEVEYTGEKKAGDLKVRTLTKEDLDKIYDPTGETKTEYTTYVYDAKYGDMLAIPSNNNYTYYWLASPDSANDLWRVGGYYGYVGSTNVGAVGVRPVVSLKSDILVSGTDVFGAWEMLINE